MPTFVGKLRGGQGGARPPSECSKQVVRQYRNRIGSDLLCLVYLFAREFACYFPPQMIALVENKTSRNARTRYQHVNKVHCKQDLVQCDKNVIATRS